MAGNPPYIETTSGDLRFKGTGNEAVIVEGDGTLPLTPMQVPYPLLSAVGVAESNAFTDLGSFSFDPSDLFDGNADLTRAIIFQAILYCAPGCRAEVRLYNLTAGAAITNTTLTSTSESPAVVSGTITVGSSPNMPNSTQTYLVQLRIDSPASPTDEDRVFCSSAQIIVSWS